MTGFSLSISQDAVIFTDIVLSSRIEERCIDICFFIMSYYYQKTVIEIKILYSQVFRHFHLFLTKLSAQLSTPNFTFYLGVNMVY